MNIDLYKWLLSLESFESIGFLNGKGSLERDDVVDRSISDEEYRAYMIRHITSSGRHPSAVNQWVDRQSGQYMDLVSVAAYVHSEMVSVNEQLTAFAPVVAEVARKLLFPRHIYFENP